MSYKVMDVANFIIDTCTKEDNPISNLKLQALLYFSWVDYYEKTGLYLFEDNMCAWQIGPVVPDVYYEYCAYAGRPINLTFERLSCSNDSLLEAIIKKYNTFHIKDLVDKTHESYTAWYKVYNNGKGNRRLIPFQDIKTMQRDLEIQTPSDVVCPKCGEKQMNYMPIDYVHEGFFDNHYGKQHKCSICGYEWKERTSKKSWFIKAFPFLEDK